MLFENKVTSFIVFVVLFFMVLGVDARQSLSLCSSLSP
jgi:hypothetical protein